MIDGSVLQSVQRCFVKKSRVVVKMVVRLSISNSDGGLIRSMLYVTSELEIKPICKELLVPSYDL